MLSVIVCTYNPNENIFGLVLEALKDQSLAFGNWELIIVDNNSQINIANQFDITWHPKARFIEEKEQGLAHARIKGVQEAKGDWIVFVDDDNVLDTHYLSKASQYFETYQKVGVFGGKAIAKIEKNIQNSIVSDFVGLLGCRDLGDEIIISDIVQDKTVFVYPYFAPIGTGMCIRKSVFKSYLQKIDGNAFRLSLGRKGSELTSGEDNDIVIEALLQNWQVAYFPDLVIQHLIPAKRTTKDYLAKMNYAQEKSWVRLLLYHNICPWPSIAPYTIPLRKAKAWFTYQAWKGEANYIKWKGACGMFEGLASNRK